MTPMISGTLKASVLTLTLMMGALTAGQALAAQKLVVEKNHSTRIALSGAAGSVIVGNPSIADVSVVDSRTLYIIGRGFGRSSVTVTDSAGRTLWDGDIVVGAPAKGGVTIYRGLKTSRMVCSNVCVVQDEGTVDVASEAAPTTE